jgi:DNA-binding response OmpR family regulator
MSESTHTVLIVDDEPHVVHVVKFKLEQAGLKVIVANSGRVGYEMACREKPDLVVTDFQMPGGTGLELATRLRKNADTAETPLIMLTARGHLAPLSDLADTNVRSLLAKPFSPRNLLKKVDELLGRHEPNAFGIDQHPGSAAA